MRIGRSARRWHERSRQISALAVSQRRLPPYSSGTCGPQLDSPTATEVHALRGELTALREELFAKEKIEPVERDRASRIASRTASPRPTGNGFRPEVIRGAREEKERVAV